MISVRLQQIGWLCMSLWATSSVSPIGAAVGAEQGTTCDPFENHGLCISDNPQEIRRALQEKEYPFHMNQIKAPALHRRGFFGAGIVIGISSSGVNAQHEALTKSYRGWDEGTQTFTHDYNWFDFFERSTEPVDVLILGTFITGVVSGRNETLNFAVAPESKFISCRMFNTLGVESPESHIT